MIGDVEVGDCPVVLLEVVDTGTDFDDGACCVGERHGRVFDREGVETFGDGEVAVVESLGDWLVSSWFPCLGRDWDLCVPLRESS